MQKKHFCIQVIPQRYLSLNLFPPMCFCPGQRAFLLRRDDQSPAQVQSVTTLIISHHQRPGVPVIGSVQGQPKSSRCVTSQRHKCHKPKGIEGFLACEFCKLLQLWMFNIIRMPTLRPATHPAEEASALYNQGISAQKKQPPEIRWPLCPSPPPRPRPDCCPA